MKIHDYKEIEADCSSGQLKITAWAKDSSGNDAFVSFQTDADSGHASFTLPQAKKLIEQLAALVLEVESAEKDGGGA